MNQIRGQYILDPDVFLSVTEAISNLAVRDPDNGPIRRLDSELAQAVHTDEGMVVDTDDTNVLMGAMRGTLRFHLQLAASIDSDLEYMAGVVDGRLEDE